MIKTDFVIVGSGIAGLFLAQKLSEDFPDKEVIVLTKKGSLETNTRYAQGGIACVTDLVTDSSQHHIKDTIIAGDGLCDPEIVRMVVETAPLRIKELINEGIEFDRTDQGFLHLAKEGGHSAHRVLHHKDATGFEIQKKLIRQTGKSKNIKVFTFSFALDLIINEQNECSGLWAVDTATGKMQTITASKTILATGGTGQVFRYTTNPAIATGDGIAMAIRAGAETKDMEFIQFHPTALYEENRNPLFLISEAVRGMGAILRNESREDFMPKYDTRGSLAPRDIVSRAIDNEINNSTLRHVWLDCRKIDKDLFIEHFPNITNACLSKSIDPSVDLIPVVPAAHYMCGGIKTDIHGQTSIKNLYACGESACTGLHGANRLASNSLLEALVFAHNICEHFKTEGTLTMSKLPTKLKPIPPFVDEETSVYIEQIKDIMTFSASILRSSKKMEHAAMVLSNIKSRIEENLKNITSLPLCEAYNMATISETIIKSALDRKENAGAHFNIDLTATQKLSSISHSA
ncbi:L-aspartate oxidase [Cytophagaceae bacterium ABcell3]|nr:L-aspartate oxidase [Cytophagaceae bacterium ABcell3]